MCAASVAVLLVSALGSTARCDQSDAACNAVMPVHSSFLGGEKRLNDPYTARVLAHGAHATPQEVPVLPVLQIFCHRFVTSRPASTHPAGAGKDRVFSCGMHQFARAALQLPTVRWNCADAAQVVLLP
jgi:hypothetical protein